MMNTCGHGRTTGECEICNLKEALRKANSQLTVERGARRKAEAERDFWERESRKNTERAIAAEQDLECAITAKREYRDRLFEAEARIKESQEQEPIGECGFDETGKGRIALLPDDTEIGSKVYAAPITFPAVKEVLRENEELKAHNGRLVEAARRSIAAYYKSTKDELLEDALNSIPQSDKE